MSVTIAHRPHVRVSRLPIVVVLAIAMTAALVAALSIEDSTSTPPDTSAQAVGAAGASVSSAAGGAAVAKNRSPLVREIMSGEGPAAAEEATASPHKWYRTPWSSGEGR